jgi:CheY-like chemotaxis protein
MGQKHALIVDDSKMARMVLGRMLEQHKLEVETAESAEEALDYLSHTRPDVIFMDHMMPGMDGFQAVKAIKNNPVTATIPIMMYTSQAGDLYVGQARALGAVGVLPKQIKPVEVSALLESLHLISLNDSEAADEGESPPESVEKQAATRRSSQTGVEQVHEPADWTELHGWLAKMLEHHGHSLRNDIETSVAQLLEDRFHDTTDHEEKQSLTDNAGKSGVKSLLTTILIIVLASLAVLFLWMHLDTQEKWRSVMAQNSFLLAELDATRVPVVEQSDGMQAMLDEQRERMDGQFSDFVTTLEWTVNQSGFYGPDEVPFSDERLQIVDGLLQRLRAMNFIGVVQMDSHVGDFCYVNGPGGELVSAPDDLSAKDCDQIGLMAAEALVRSGEQSVSFANFLAAFEAAPGQGIDIEIRPQGNVQPLYPYPAGLQGRTAGEWNRAALRNNRVRFYLHPSSN